MPYRKDKFPSKFNQGTNGGFMLFAFAAMMLFGLYKWACG
jgi:hypothetical protein